MPTAEARANMSQQLVTEPGQTWSPSTEETDRPLLPPTPPRAEPCCGLHPLLWGHHFRFLATQDQRSFLQEDSSPSPPNLREVKPTPSCPQKMAHGQWEAGGESDASGPSQEQGTERAQVGILSGLHPSWGEHPQ